MSGRDLIWRHCAKQEDLSLRAIGIIRSSIEGDLASPVLHINRSAALRLHESVIKLACAEESARIYAVAMRRIKQAPIGLTVEEFASLLPVGLEQLPENPTSPIDLARATQRQNVLDDIASMFNYVRPKYGS